MSLFFHIMSLRALCVISVLKALFKSNGTTSDNFSTFPDAHSCLYFIQVWLHPEQISAVYIELLHTAGMLMFIHLHWLLLSHHVLFKTLFFQFPHALSLTSLSLLYILLLDFLPSSCIFHVLFTLLCFCSFYKILSQVPSPPVWPHLCFISLHAYLFKYFAKPCHARLIVMEV